MNIHEKKCIILFHSLHLMAPKIGKLLDLVDSTPRSSCFKGLMTSIGKLGRFDVSKKEGQKVVPQ
jgi:hypothetical protein